MRCRPPAAKLGAMPPTTRFLDKPNSTAWRNWRPVWHKKHARRRPEFAIFRAQGGPSWKLAFRPTASSSISGQGLPQDPKRSDGYPSVSGELETDGAPLSLQARTPVRGFNSVTNDRDFRRSIATVRPVHDKDPWLHSAPPLHPSHSSKYHGATHRPEQTGASELVIVPPPGAPCFEERASGLLAVLMSPPCQLIHDKMEAAAVPTRWESVPDCHRWPPLGSSARDCEEAKVAPHWDRLSGVT